MAHFCTLVTWAGAMPGRPDFRLKLEKREVSFLFGPFSRARFGALLDAWLPSLVAVAPPRAGVRGEG